MKKAIIVVFILCLIVGTGLILTNNTNLMKNIAEMFEEPDEPYTEDFNINSLKISSNMYYYNRLTESQKLIYTSIANGIRELKSEVKLKNYDYVDAETTKKDVGEALHKFLLDHPEVFYVDDKYAISTKSGITGTSVILNFTYQFSSIDELNSSVEELDKKLNEIIESAQLEEGKDFENEQKLHDILSNKITYYEYTDINEIPSKYHSIYGTLTENIAVCDGISKTMQLLLNKAGIESILVSGKLNSASHAWNVVKLEDKWYHLDVTSDNSVKTENKVVIHSYFNITAEEIKKTHSIDNEELIPEATDTKYNYYVYTNKNLNKDDDFSAKLKEIIEKNGDEKLVEFKVSGTDDVPEKIIEVLRKNKFTNYLESQSTKFVYYNVLDTYIILKK